MNVSQESNFSSRAAEQTEDRCNLLSGPSFPSLLSSSGDCTSRKTSRQLSYIDFNALSGEQESYVALDKNIARFNEFITLLPNETPKIESFFDWLANHKETNSNVVYSSDPFLYAFDNQYKKKSFQNHQKVHPINRAATTLSYLNHQSVATIGNLQRKRSYTLTADDDYFKYRSSLPVKKRKSLSLDQQNELKYILNNITVFPNTKLRNELGMRLGINPRSVQIWFQNQRQKMSKKLHV